MKWPTWIKEKLNLLVRGRVGKFWQSRQAQTLVIEGSIPSPPTRYPTINPRYPIVPSEKHTYLDYAVMTRDQLEPIVYDALKKRHWQYDMANLEFYHEWSREVLPDMSHMWRSEDGMRGFYIDYLTFLDMGLEQEAHQHLQKLMNKQSVEEMYDLYMRIVQVPKTKMKQRMMNESNI